MGKSNERERETNFVKILKGSSEKTAKFQRTRNLNESSTNFRSRYCYERLKVMALWVKCSLCTDVSYFLYAERRDIFSFCSKEIGDVCIQAKCSVVCQSPAVQ